MHQVFTLPPKTMMFA